MSDEEALFYAKANLLGVTIQKDVVVGEEILIQMNAPDNLRFTEEKWGTTDSYALARDYRLGLQKLQTLAPR